MRGSWFCESLIQIPVTGRMSLQLTPKAVFSARLSTNSAAYNWRSLRLFHALQLCSDKQKVRGHMFVVAPQFIVTCNPPQIIFLTS